MPRIEAEIEAREARAATAISELAESIQDLAYYCQFRDVWHATQKEVLRAYRVLSGATAFYFGDDSPLIYEAPDTRFRPKEKTK
jgi:hypothetical protein